MVSIIVNKELDKVEAEYYVLSYEKKTSYKSDITEMRKNYEKQRKEFYKYEKAIDTQRPDTNEDQELREQLLQELEGIVASDKLMDQIITMGHEASQAQRNAGKNLGDQRNVILKSSKNTESALNGMKKANRKILIIQARSVAYAASLYGIIVVLLLIIL